MFGGGADGSGTPRARSLWQHAVDVMAGSGAAVEDPAAGSAQCNAALAQSASRLAAAQQLVDSVRREVKEGLSDVEQRLSLLSASLDRGVMLTRQRAERRYGRGTQDMLVRAPLPCLTSPHDSLHARAHYVGVGRFLCRRTWTRGLRI